MTFEQLIAVAEPVEIPRRLRKRVRFAINASNRKTRSPVRKTRRDQSWQRLRSWLDQGRKVPWHTIPSSALSARCSRLNASPTSGHDAQARRCKLGNDPRKNCSAKNCSTGNHPARRPRTWSLPADSNSSPCCNGPAATSERIQKRTPRFGDPMNSIPASSRTWRIFSTVSKLASIRPSERSSRRMVESASPVCWAS
jgi:hypothetical protein